jgi:hypothetical protein
MTAHRKEILFINQPDSPELFPEPNSPRTPFAKYVTDAMPLDLADIREGTINYVDLATKHALLLEAVSSLIENNTDEHAAAVMQMDLAFMLGGYLPVGSIKAYDTEAEQSGPSAYDIAPTQLLTLLDLQAERFGLPKRMDYELIIDVNSAEYHRTGVIRTFLGGEMALGERDFYQGHSEAEAFMKEASTQLGALIDNPYLPNKVEILSAAAANVRTLGEYMKKYHDLKNPVFNAMRAYLAPYPDGTRNASGAFMPSIQLTELTLHAPSEQYDRQLDESMPYFPRWARAIIPTLRDDSRNGKNIHDMVKTGKLKLTEEEQVILDNIVSQFVGFRTAHLAVVRKKIPTPFEGEAVPKSIKAFQKFGEPDIMASGSHGTADFHIINLLAGSVHRLVNLRKELQDSQLHITTTDNPEQ